jgi:hypothetical protein
MGELEDLAKLLSDPKRIGLDGDLVKQLRIADEDVTKSRLRAQREDDRAHKALHLLGAYVVDDTDAIGKGEVYWWAIPMLGDSDGKITWNALAGIPTGAAPEKVGSHEWMKFPLKQPPLLLTIPPSDDVVAGFVHLAFFDDDWEPAKLPPAIAAGLRALGELKMPIDTPENFVAPIRKAIFESLLAKRDDLMLERTLRVLREEGRGYGTGTIHSELTEFIRAYWIVRDIDKTETCGPWSLTKGQEQRVLPPSGLTNGGMLAIFARGGEVRVNPFGSLTTETPFLNVGITAQHEASLSAGFTVTAEANAEVIAFYTPR